MDLQAFVELCFTRNSRTSMAAATKRPLLRPSCSLPVTDCQHYSSSSTSQPLRRPSADCTAMDGVTSSTDGLAAYNDLDLNRRCFHLSPVNVSSSSLCASAVSVINSCGTSGSTYQPQVSNLRPHNASADISPWSWKPRERVNYDPHTVLSDDNRTNSLSMTSGTSNCFRDGSGLCWPSTAASLQPTVNTNLLSDNCNDRPDTCWQHP